MDVGASSFAKHATTQNKDSFKYSRDIKLELHIKSIVGIDSTNGHLTGMFHMRATWPDPTLLFAVFPDWDKVSALMNTMSALMNTGLRAQPPLAYNPSSFLTYPSHHPSLFSSHPHPPPQVDFPLIEMGDVVRLDQLVEKSCGINQTKAGNEPEFDYIAFATLKQSFDLTDFPYDVQELRIR
jgi:hypothetical protein